jgi:iron complex outermembrane receptor protein
MRVIIILLLAIISQAAVTAQPPATRTTPRRAGGPAGRLSGRVAEQKGNTPLPGATVYIPDLKIGVVAGANGQYQFKTLPYGNYLVEVHFTGYKTVTRNVQVKDSSAADFLLDDNVVEESAVVVTGLSKATQIKRSPVPIVSVSHAAMLRTLSTNIIDAIARIPGVNAMTTGPNVSKPAIRGLGSNRLLTLYDGIRQEGQQWGDEHGVEVDQYGIERVEIIKGPASLSYGSDALAGVVNLIPYQPVHDGEINGEIISEYHANNGMLGGSVMLRGTEKGFEWMGRLSHKTAANYRNKMDGRVYNTGFRETDADLSMGLHGKWGYSHVSFSLYDDLQEIPDGSRDSLTRRFTKQVTENDTVRAIVTGDQLRSYRISDLHQHVQHYRVYAANNFTLGSGRLAFNLGYQQSQRREYNHPAYPQIPGLSLQLATFSYDLKYYLSESNGWNLTMGINGMYQDNEVTKGTDFIIPTYQQFDIGPFVLIKKSFGKLDIAGGARYDNRSFKNQELYTATDASTGFERPVDGIDTVGAKKLFSNYDRQFSGFSGSVGATYNLTEKLAFKINLARGFRAPNISEISANGVHPGTNLYQIGNLNFKPEYSLQQDIGFSYSSRFTVISISLFKNHLSNYIFNQRLLNGAGGDSIIVPGNQTYQFQQGSADLYGGEIAIDFHPVKPVHFENSLSMVYGYNKSVDAKFLTDSNRYLPFIPPLHGNSELRFDFEAKKSHVVDGFVKAELAFYATQGRVYLADNTETPTAGYALFNAGAGAGFTNKKGRVVLNLYLMVNNLFDVAYQDHLSRLKYFEPYPSDPRGHGIYNMGRNFSVKLNIPFNLGSAKGS